MKRILLLIDALSSGGAERQISYLAIFLKRKGHDVRLMTFYDIECFYETDLHNAGIKPECDPGSQNILYRIRMIASVVKKWNPDVVVAYKRGASMAACLAKALVKFPLIVSERNTTQALSLIERMKFLTYSVADLIVPNSRSQARFIESHYPRLSNKTYVVTNMVNTDKFCPKLAQSNEIPIVLTTARIMPQKNIINYLKAVNIIKQKGIKCHFDWYGNDTGVPEYVEVVKNEMKRLDIADMISFHKPERNVQRLYQEADVYCLPSLYEGFPNVICEAMSAGLPIVCSNVCDNPDLVTPGQNGYLFLPSNPEDIADKLIKILRLSNLEKEAMKKANRSKIIQMCSPEAFINNMETLFDKICN